VGPERWTLSPRFATAGPATPRPHFDPPPPPATQGQPRPPPAARENTQNGNQDHRDREDRCALGARSARGDLPSTRTNARHMPSTLPNPTAVAMCRRSRDDDWSGRRAASTRRWSTYFAGVVPTSAVNTRAPGAPRRSHTPSRPYLSAGLARSRTRGLRVAHRRRAENYRFNADRGFAEPGLLDRIRWLARWTGCSWRPRWREIRSRVVRKAPLLRTIRVHDVELGIAIAKAGKDDLASIRRP
jgi:hypothetical protein